MIERISNSEDHCPICHSDSNIIIDDFLEDDYICFEKKCTKCGLYYKDWYHLNYAETKYEENE